MTKVINKQKETRAEKLVKNFNSLTSKRAKALGHWVRNHGEYRSEDLTTGTDGGALIPSSVLNTAEDLSARKFQLKPLVNNVQVSTGRGAMPLLDPNEVAKTKAELQEDPDLDSDLHSVKFECQSYLGRLNISNEYLQDTHSNIMTLLSHQLGTVMINTQNKAIADTMAQVPANNIASLDDLINAIEDVDPRYQSNIFIDTKSFAKVRTFKDSNNRYIFNENQNTILGIPVVVVPAYTGLTGIYIGDLKTAIAFFDRSEDTLQYNRPSIYGSSLLVALRFDTKLAYAPALKHLQFATGASK